MPWHTWKMLQLVQKENVVHLILLVRRNMFFKKSLRYTKHDIKLYWLLFAVVWTHKQKITNICWFFIIHYMFYCTASYFFSSDWWRNIKRWTNWQSTMVLTTVKKIKDCCITYVVLLTISGQEHLPLYTTFLLAKCSKLKTLTSFVRRNRFLDIKNMGKKSGQVQQYMCFKPISLCDRRGTNVTTNSTHDLL